MDLGGKFTGCLHFASQGYEGVLPSRQVGEQGQSTLGGYAPMVVSGVRSCLLW